MGTGEGEGQGCRGRGGECVAENAMLIVKALIVVHDLIDAG